MSNFKKGDMVRLLAFENDTQWEKKYGGEIGGIYVVPEPVGNLANLIYVARNGTGFYTKKDRIELVTEDTKTIDLEELVRKANDRAGGERMSKELPEWAVHRAAQIWCEDLHGSAIAQALIEAEARGYRRGIEAAAKLCEEESRYHSDISAEGEDGEADRVPPEEFLSWKVGKKIRALASEGEKGEGK